MKEKETSTSLLSFVKPHKSNYITSVIFATIGVIFSIMPYYVVSQIIIELIGGTKDIAIYLRWGLIIAVMWIVRVTCHTISTALSHKATFSVITEIRTQIANKLTRLPLGYVIDTPTGKLKNIMVEKVDSIEPTLAHVLPEMTSNLLGSLLTLIFLFAMDYKIALAALVTLPAGFIPYMAMMKNYEKNYGNFVEKNKTLNSVAVEYINGIEVIKAFNQSAGSYKKFRISTEEAAHSAISWMRSCNVHFSIALSVFPATLVTVLPIGCILYMNNSISLNVLILSIILSLGIITPLITAMAYTDDLAKIGTIVNDIVSVTNQKELVRPNQKKQIDTFDIKMKNVSFSYESNNDKSNIIDNLNLDINASEVTALVGPSGGGKSTIAKLIASLWDIQKGDIYIGGVKEKDIPLSQLNEMIAYVAQDNYLFNDTVRNNIRMGNMNVSDKEVEKYAKLSGCHDFICNLENGYETIVGDSGGQLSGGERQRISIARAMLKDAPIIILDEATAYTDPENEAIIQSAIAKLVRGKTLIVIAHRLSTIKDVDKIVVINKGHVEAEGSHKELINKCEMYREMWNAHIGVKDSLINKDKEVC